MTEDTDAGLKDALIGASTELEHYYAKQVPDLSPAHRRRVRRRTTQARLMLGVGCFALIAGVAALARSGASSDPKVQHVGAQASNPSQLTLPDGQRLSLNLPSGFLDGPTPRVTLGARLQLHGACCPNTFVSFSDTATGASVVEGSVLDSWTNSAGMQLRLLRGPGNVEFIESVIGRFRMEIRVPPLTSDEARSAATNLSVVTGDGGYPEVDSDSIDQTHGASGSALLDYGANEPTVSLLASTCTSNGVVHPVEADTPEAQRCYPEAGFKVTLQASFGQSTVGQLDDLSESIDIQKVQ